MQDKLPATLKGIVTPFKGNGRKLGYPTANITTPTVLKDGVYFGVSTVGSYNDKPSIIFIGTPTTVGDTERRVEVHILDAKDEDYYGLNLTVQIQYYHRENKTFSSIDELLVVMKHDETAARAWLGVRD